MSSRDTLLGLGRVAATALGQTLVDWAGGALEKAQRPATPRGPVPTDPAATDPKTIFWDPFSIVEQLGYKDRPSQITYGTLKAIAWRVPIIPTILQTRINQVAAFSRTPRSRHELGYRVMMRDPEAEPTPAARKWMRDAEALIEHADPVQRV